MYIEKQELKYGTLRNTKTYIFPYPVSSVNLHSLVLENYCEKPCAASLAIIKSCETQPNALERSVNNAAKTPTLSTPVFHFSIIAS